LLPLEKSPVRPARPRHHEYRGLGVTGWHRLHYTEWGRRNSRRVVVCAHGYSGNARDFDPLARSLARDARVICLDFAGRGDSDWLPAAPHYHFGQFLADINSLVAHLRVNEVEWVGTSMGGLLGMMLAAQPATPVRRLVMNDVGAFVPIDALQRIARDLQSPERFASLEAVEAHLRHTHREWGDIPDEQYRELTRHHARPLEGGGFRLHYDPQITRLVQPFPLASGVYFWDSWYRVRCPVLLLRGERSEVFPAAVAETMVQVKPGVQLVEIAGAGHAPALMSAGQLALVGNFLAGGDAIPSAQRAAGRASPSGEGQTRPA
jgi:pimeloyl-ACP methyl ester carboxylesterase